MLCFLFSSTGAGFDCSFFLAMNLAIVLSTNVWGYRSRRNNCLSRSHSSVKYFHEVEKHDATWSLSEIVYIVHLHDYHNAGEDLCWLVLHRPSYQDDAHFLLLPFPGKLLFLVNAKQLSSIDKFHNGSGG